MILTLDRMAERYGMLPSQVMNHGSTFDLYVMDAALSYDNYHQKKSQGDVAQSYSVDELQEMMKGIKP